MRAVISLFFPLFLFAQVHYAKLEPVESYVVKAAAAGQVVMADESAEGRIGDGKIVVQIDDRVDRAQKSALEVTLDALKSTLKLTEEMEANQQKVYEKDYRYYLRTRDMKPSPRPKKTASFRR